MVLVLRFVQKPATQFKGKQMRLHLENVPSRSLSQSHHSPVSQLLPVCTCVSIIL